MFKGAGDMGARDIVERIEAEGGSINAATGYERTSFEVRALDGSLPLAMQVVSDLVFRPTLDPAEIEREKDVVAQEIAEAFDTPDDHVFEMAQTRAFAGQPLGRPILGSVDSLKPVDRDTHRRLARAAVFARPDGGGGVRRGGRDRTAGPGRALVRRCGRRRPPTRPSRRASSAATATLTRRIEQANIVFQLPALSATRSATYPAVRLFTEILGGGMASRLFQSAREERGLAYAIDAYHEPYEDAGVLGIYAGAAADRAGRTGPGLRRRDLKVLADRRADRRRAVARQGGAEGAACGCRTRARPVARGTDGGPDADLRRSPSRPRPWPTGPWPRPSRTCGWRRPRR